MQTWIRANIGKLIARMTNAEIAISNGLPYENENDLDNRVTALETAVGTPYENESNLDDRVTGTENAIGMPYTNTDDIDTRLTALENASPIGADSIYSYTEQAVGTWIDGKTIYKKTVRGEGFSNNAVIDILPDPGYRFDKFIKVEAMQRYTDPDYSYQWAGALGNDRTPYTASLNLIAGDILVSFYNPHYISEAFVTVWYTKPEVTE